MHCFNIVYYYIIPSHFQSCNVTHSLTQEQDDLIFGGPCLAPRNILRKYFIPFVYHRVVLVLLSNILWILFHDSGFLEGCKIN